MTGPIVACAYHSGFGHTAVLAQAVHEGAADAGATVVSIRVDSITDEQWKQLDAADAIIFGAPTYMGTASAAFHGFAQATSGRWIERAWIGKLAAGFTVSGAKNGDKLHTLQYFGILAAQHGMHWINLDLMPGWNSSTGAETDLNRLGVSLGAAGQANIDEDADAMPKADVETARHLGRRVAEIARAFVRVGVPSPV
jgi:multimeric flavodoxin WrbA